MKRCRPDRVRPPSAASSLASRVVTRFIAFSSGMPVAAPSGSSSLSMAGPVALTVTEAADLELAAGRHVSSPDANDAPGFLRPARAPLRSWRSPRRSRLPPWPTQASADRLRRHVVVPDGRARHARTPEPWKSTDGRVLRKHAARRQLQFARYTAHSDRPPPGDRAAGPARMAVLPVIRAGESGSAKGSTRSDAARSGQACAARGSTRAPARDRASAGTAGRRESSADD